MLESRHDRRRSGRENHVALAVAALAVVAVVVIIFWHEPPTAAIADPYTPDLHSPGGNGVVDPLEAVSLLEESLSRPGPGAVAVLEELLLHSDAVGYTAALHLARIYHEEGLNAGALYGRALELHPTTGVRIEMAEHLESLGDSEEAREALAALAPWAPVAPQLLDLGADPALVLSRLEEERAWNTILEVVSGGKAPGMEESRPHLRALGSVGRHSDALPGLARYWENDPDDDIIGWWYARALEATGDPERAAAVYAEIGQRGHYRRGIVLERLGRPAEAASAYAASANPEGLWRAGRILEGLGRQDDAIEVYDQLARMGVPASGDAGYRAYILLSEAGAPEAGGYLELLAGYPAWMDRLGLSPVFPLEMPYGPSEPEFLERASAYLEAGREDLSGLEILIGARAAGGLDMLCLGEWHLERGDFFAAVRIGIPALDARPCPRAYRLAYPLAYHDLVLEAAARYSLDPFLLLAVMREESHFRADAVSWAGAMGLMQVMPATGREIARGMGIGFEVSDLLDPEISIAFGASFLRSMLWQFDGDVDRALAAYNGGPGNVRRWIATPPGSEPAGFPTAIPFIETRLYITKVMDSYLTYRWLYGEGAGQEP